MRGLRAATSFLTRLPGGDDVRAEDIARGVPWFPVVGGLLGFAVGGVYAAGRSALPSFPAAALAVAFVVWATGAIHEDGLADTADAFGGVRSRVQTLRILKDPALGAYGVVALVISMLLRVGALAALDAPTALVVLPAAHAMSRAGAIGLLVGPVATDDGLGSSYASVATRRQIVMAVAIGCLIGAVALRLPAIAAAAGVVSASSIVRRIARRRIGGITGDVLGAAQQAGEILVLLIGVVAARRGWLHVLW